VSAATLSCRLEDAALDLNDATVKHTGAVVAVDEARQELEVERSRMICNGVDGKNEAQREAFIRLELDFLYTVLHVAETALTEARCELECSRTLFDVAKCSVRALEASK
jgi:hypothetical protein